MHTTPISLARWATLTCALTLPLGALAQTVVYATGFESPTFTMGTIGDSYGLPSSGQDGWRAAPQQAYGAGPSLQALVSGQRVASGSQALQITANINTGNVGVWREYTANPIVLNSPTDPFSVSMRLYLDQAPASDLTWGISLSTGGCCGLGMTVTGDNRVLYGHNLANQSSTFTPGFDLHNTWLTATIERDPLDYTLLRLSLSTGSQSWSQRVSSPGGAMPIVSFGAGVPTFPTAATAGVAYVDDLRIGYSLAPVPEPAVWALWLGGAAALTWRGATRTRGSAEPSAAA
jgi:hypothetical protein